MTATGQKDSAAILMADPLGEFYEMDRPVPLKPIEINFPTLFVTECRLPSAEVSFSDFDHYLVAEGFPEIEKEYDYSLGSGWILHKKHNMALDNLWIEDRFIESLGWIYIRHYPWVYGLDFGWRFVVEAGISWDSNAWWMFENNLGWFWTTRDIYPFIYMEENGWSLYGQN